MLLDDINIISKVFAGSVIRKGFGKICGRNVVALYIIIIEADGFYPGTKLEQINFYG